MAVTVTSITPTLAAQNAVLHRVEIIGTGFVSGLSLDFGGVDVVASDITVPDSTHIRCTLTIASAAATTARDVTVTNVDTSSGVLTNGLTVTLLSFQAYQPFASAGLGYQRNTMQYDCRGDAHPLMYLGSEGDGTLWTLDRLTGSIQAYSGQFNTWADGNLDQETGGNIWWLGVDPLNLTTARQSLTRFAANTLDRIGSATSDGSTISYSAPCLIRVDRESSHHFVWRIDAADSHDVHGNLWAFEQTSRQQVYFLSRSSWYDQPVGGAITRVTDMVGDADGNLWLVSLDDSGTYLLLWKVEPDGTQIMVEDLSSNFTIKGYPLVRWVATDNTLVIGASNSTDLIKWSLDSTSVVDAMTLPLTITGDGNAGSFHHPLTDKDSIYLMSGWPSAPSFYEIDIVNMYLKRSIDFTGVAGVNGVFFNGFSQSYDGARNFRAYTPLYDATAGGVWCEDFWQGVVAFLGFGDNTDTGGGGGGGDLGTNLFLLEHVELLS